MSKPKVDGIIQYRDELYYHRDWIVSRNEKISRYTKLLEKIAYSDLTVEEMKRLASEELERES